MIKPLISINGQDVRGYNLVPLSGTIEALLAPRKFKKLTENANSSIHGTRLITTPSRLYDKRDLSLSFFLFSDSIVDLERDLEALQQMFVDGVNSSGVNEFVLAEYDICLRLTFIETSKFRPWYPHGKATVTFKFTEQNPNNRSLPVS